MWRLCQWDEIEVGTVVLLDQKRKRTNIAISATSESRIHSGAKRRLALLAVPAPSICNIEGHHHSVPLLEQRHTRTDLLDDPHVLMTKCNS